ncbi:hypothetical protein Tco_0537049 [Tanacetum coccineum]
MYSRRLGPVWFERCRSVLVSSQETSTIAPVISSAAPMVETTLVASPTGLCGLVPYTGSDSDSPDEMTSPEHISPANYQVSFGSSRLARCTSQIVFPRGDWGEYSTLGYEAVRSSAGNHAGGSVGGGSVVLASGDRATDGCDDL